MNSFKRNVISIGLLSVLVVSLVFALTGCGFLNQAPEAKIATTPEISNGVAVGTEINFYGDNSEDSDGTIEHYEWNFKTNKAEDATSTSMNTTYTYDAPDTYTVTLTVTDDDGASDSTTATVEVTEPELNASFTISPDPATEDDPVEFDASSSTGDIDSYSWNFGAGEGTGSGETTTHTYSDPGNYTVQLTIEDPLGSVSITGRTLEVQSASSTT